MSDPLNDGMSMILDPVMWVITTVVNFVSEYILVILGIAAVLYFLYYIIKEFQK